MWSVPWRGGGGGLEELVTDLAVVVDLKSSRTWSALRWLNEETVEDLAVPWGDGTLVVRSMGVWGRTWLVPWGCGGGQGKVGEDFGRSTGM